ncbi:MAG: serine/threonine protein kinase [Silvanigrellaceae bacterium]
MATSQPKYILTERIAQGGMAEIHLGKSVGLDGFARVCAFKRILPHFAQDNEFVEMFRNEAQVAKQLQNKNIVQVFDFVSDGSSYMLVMEFVDGQDLRALLAGAEQKRKRIPIEMACYIAMETLSGLSYAHSAVDVSGKSMGIIHRDVSPQNVLLSYEGDVKITDFGIAKAENQASNTRVGVLKGKFRYMSPEQASGYNIDARSDLFAVGIILFEMLTMTRLFKGEDLAVLEAVRACQIRPPSQVNNSGVPPELDAIVMRLLSRDPLQRYQTGREAVRDLSRFLYKYRPDFFVGELADFMQDVFSEKLEAARERLRSTLALPTGSFDTSLRSQGSFGQRPAMSESAQVVDLSNNMTNARDQLKNAGGSIRSGSAFALGQSARKNELVLDENTASLEISQLNKTQTRQGNSSIKINRNRTAATMSKIEMPPSIYFEPNSRQASKSGSLLMPFVALLVAVAALFVALLYLRNRNVGTQFVLSVTGSPADVKVAVEIDGQPFNKGKPLSLPLQIPVGPGLRVLELKRPGLMTKRLEFKVGSPTSKLSEHVVFERDPAVPTAQLKIITDPPGAQITHTGGWDSGTSPFIFRLVPVGSPQRFRVVHPNCRPGTFEEVMSSADANRTRIRKLELRDCKSE